MDTPRDTEGKWNERSKLPAAASSGQGMFGLFFERSAEAIWLFDPQARLFVDCNQPAVDLMRCGSKEQLLRTRPEDLAPPLQPDGTPSGKRAAEITACVESKGSLRFEWVARRFDGKDVPLEVLATSIPLPDRALHVVVAHDVTQRKAVEAALIENESKFRLLFQCSADSILLIDPEKQSFLDCNEAALKMTRGGSREWLLSQSIPALAPEFQPDGAVSSRRSHELVERALREGPQRFEWTARGQDGSEFPLEVILTPIQTDGGRLLVAVSRDITYRKEAELRARQLNLELERRITERTNELVRANQFLRNTIVEREQAEALLKESEARARTLVEHAPDAIVVLEAETGRFIDANQNALALYGMSREELLKCEPSDVSPAFQPDGRPSIEVAREKMREAVEGGAPVFEWWHRNSRGVCIPCEIRLVRLPAQGRHLVRGSIIDNSERQRQEKIQKAIYQISEAIHTTDDLDSLYRRIHLIIRELMPADNFYIALYDPLNEQFSFPYFIDEMDPPPEPVKLSTGLTSHVLKTGKPLLVNRRSPIRKESSGMAVLVEDTRETVYQEAGTPAAVWLGAPLSCRGQVIGVLAVQDYRDEDAYGEGEKRILTFVAEQTALAIDRKRAEQALRKRSLQIARHRDVLLELAQLDKSDFRVALEKICCLSASSLEAARVGYWSLQEDGSKLSCELLCLREKQAVAERPEGASLDQKDCPAYFEALAVKRPIVATHALTYPATAALADGYLRPLGINSILDVPVWLHGKVMGVLCHEHVGAPREWTAEEVDFANSLATMVSLAHEAAQRARSEQALRESEEKFRALFEASSQGVMLHDEQKFLEVNPATVRILGYDSADQILGKHPADTAAPIQPNGMPAEALARRHIEDCIANGSARFDWLCRNPRGGEVPIEVILTRIKMGGQHIIQAVINDITERKQAEAELLRALAREKELGQLKSSFVSMVSHEFRTPLGIIMSSAEILQDYLEQLDPDERQHHLQSIAKNTRRMSDLMEEVLLLGRFEAGKMDFQPARIDLAGFCRRLVDDSLSATSFKCPILLSLTSLPEQARADERLLRHIFLNLLSNAIKYSEPDQPVRFTVQREDEDAVCSIQDEGIGIPEADFEWLFDAFHRGRNVGQRPGTGLGLVIVKRCIELHGGRIKIESTVGQGTTVKVRLPLFS
jgi:PAS domain S-box-containing protein